MNYSTFNKMSKSLTNTCQKLPELKVMTHDFFKKELQSSHVRVLRSSSHIFGLFTV